MRAIYIIISFCLFFQINASSQNKILEKLYYAHIDKELYLPDENIWFKIYAHTPYALDTNSHNIYVDLVDENKKVIEHQVYLTYFSSINGQIKIPRDYPFSQVNLLIYQVNDNKQQINFYQKEIAVLNQALTKRKNDFKTTQKLEALFASVQNQKISIQKDTNDITVVIDNEKNEFNDLFLSIKNHADTIYTKPFSLNNKRKLTIRLPKQQLATGYYLFSISDLKNNVIYQEWIFNMSSEHLLQPIITLDTLSLDKDGKNVWKISNLPNANLSISIVDADIPTSNKNIASELLFNQYNNTPLSNMGSYFTKNTVANEKAIDSIIKVNRITPLPIVAINNNPDDYLTVKGKIVKTSKRNVPLPKQLSVILGSTNNKTSIIQTPVNLDSSFILNKLMFYDTVFARGVLDKNENNDFKVVLQQDTVVKTPSFEFVNELFSETYNFIENNKANMLIKNAELLDSLLKKFTLKQVTISTRPEFKYNKLDKIYSFGLFSSSNAYRLNVAEDDFFQNGFDLGNYIVSKIPGLTYSSNYNTMMDFDASPFTWRGSPTSIYLDEMKVSWDMVRDMPRINIGYIKVFRPIFFGDVQNGTGGAIVIYTKKHFDESSPVDTKDAKLLRGYFSSNNFSNEVVQLEEKSKQVNTTLYWDPYFSFYEQDAKEKTIRFTNNQITKRFLIKIEGIDMYGQIVYFEKLVE